jgi:hypothetical protein
MPDHSPWCSWYLGETLLFSFLFLARIVARSWLTRVIADTTLNMELRMYAGMMSAVAIAGYFLSVASITIQSDRAKAF